MVPLVSWIIAVTNGSINVMNRLINGQVYGGSS